MIMISFPKENADFYVDKDNEVLQSKKLQDIPEEKIKTGNMGERILHTKKIPVCDSMGIPSISLVFQKI